MEVREGYKLTEVGVIPEDWSMKSYDEIFTFLSTATYARSQLFNHEQIQYLHYGDIHTKWDITLDISKHNLPKIDRGKFKGAAFIKDGDVITVDFLSGEVTKEATGEKVKIKPFSQVQLEIYKRGGLLVKAGGK